MMSFIIPESSTCTLSFCSYPLRSLILVILSSGFIVTSSSFHLANLLRDPVLEAPVVG